MTDGSKLSEEELLECEIWRDSDGRCYTLEELPDQKLSAAISYIEQVVNWRKDWLPALLCEKERRDELRDDTLDYIEHNYTQTALFQDTANYFRDMFLSRVSPPELPYGTRYRVIDHTYVCTLSVQRIEEVVRKASLLSDEEPIPKVPDNFVIEIAGPIRSKETADYIDAMIGSVGKVRLIKALYSDRPPDLDKKLKEQWLKGTDDRPIPDSKGSFLMFKEAVNRLPDYDSMKSWQKNRSTQKSIKDKYRK